MGWEHDSQEVLAEKNATTNSKDFDSFQESVRIQEAVQKEQEALERFGSSTLTNVMNDTIHVMRPENGITTVALSDEHGDDGSIDLNITEIERLMTNLAAARNTAIKQLRKHAKRVSMDQVRNVLVRRPLSEEPRES